MIGRRSLFGLPLTAALGSGQTQEPKRDVLFKYCRERDAPGYSEQGAFLLSQVCGYRAAPYDAIIRRKDGTSGWQRQFIIDTKGAGLMAHVMDQNDFDRFEREYTVWCEHVSVARPE